MGKPLISIITITLNSEKTLEQTIRSVIEQDYENIEYIIIDGASTDRTLDIIKKHKNEIARWISESDRGTSDAVNKGIKMSSGEIIGLISSDDFYEPDILNNVMEVFQNNPDTDVVYGNIRYRNNEKSEINIIKQPEDISRLSPGKILLKGIPIILTSAFYRKKAFEKYGLFDLSYKIANDSELFLRFVKNRIHFSYIDKLIVNMRSGGVSNIFYRKTLKEHRRLLINYGFNKCKVNLYFVFIYVLKMLEENVGTILRALGLKSIIKMYRKFLYPETTSEKNS